MERAAATEPVTSPPEALTGEEFSESPVSGRRKFGDVEEPERVSETPGRRSVTYDDEDYPRGRYDRDLERQGPFSSEYRIDLGEWFQYGTDHFGEVIASAIGFGLLYLVISIAIALIPCVSWLAQLLILPPLEAGLTVVCMAQLKGKRWQFGDYFAGFQWWGNLVGFNFLWGLAVGVGMVPTVIFVFALLNAGGRGGPGADALAALVAVAALNALLVSLYGIRLGFFAVPLIIDRSYGPTDAMRASWQLSRGHFWGLFGITLLLGLMNIAIITIPLTNLIRTAGYLLVAGTRPPRMPSSQADES
jgi:hypothetical protein